MKDHKQNFITGHEFIIHNFPSCRRYFLLRSIFDDFMKIYIFYGKTIVHMKAHTLSFTTGPKFMHKKNPQKSGIFGWSRNQRLNEHTFFKNKGFYAKTHKNTCIHISPP